MAAFTADDVLKRAQECEANKARLTKKLAETDDEVERLCDEIETLRQQRAVVADRLAREDQKFNEWIVRRQQGSCPGPLSIATGDRVPGRSDDTQDEAESEQNIVVSPPKRAVRPTITKSKTDDRTLQTIQKVRPNVILLDGRFYELSCGICGRKKSQEGLFFDLGRLVSHYTHSHRDELELWRIDRWNTESVKEHFPKHLIRPDDLERMKRGHPPIHLNDGTAWVREGGTHVRKSKPAQAPGRGEDGRQRSASETGDDAPPTPTRVLRSRTAATRPRLSRQSDDGLLASFGDSESEDEASDRDRNNAVITYHDIGSRRARQKASSDDDAAAVANDPGLAGLLKEHGCLIYEHGKLYEAYCDLCGVNAPQKPRRGRHFAAGGREGVWYHVRSHAHEVDGIASMEDEDLIALAEVTDEERKMLQDGSATILSVRGRAERDTFRSLVSSAAGAESVKWKNHVVPNPRSRDIFRPDCGSKRYQASRESDQDDEEPVRKKPCYYPC